MGKIHDDLEAFKTDRLFEFREFYQLKYKPGKLDPNHLVYRSYYEPLHINEGENVISGTQLIGVSTNPSFLAFLASDRCEDKSVVIIPVTGDKSTPVTPEKLDTPVITSAQINPGSTRSRLLVQWEPVHHATAYIVEYTTDGGTYKALPECSDDETSISQIIDDMSVLGVRMKAKGDGTNYTDSDLSSVVFPTTPNVT